MGDHKRSLRFKDDGFDVEVLEESTDRGYIEAREEYWISKLDTYENGLNESWSGKGWGHRSPNFTTLGYVYSEESRKKMSDSAKERARREGSEARAERSRALYRDPEYRAKQVAAKKGKRLRPPKITDEQVFEIRALYESQKEEIEKEVSLLNEERYKKNPSWKPSLPHSYFAKKYATKYNATPKYLSDILLWKTRKEVLPSLYKNN
jgi:hypothetical protein